MFKKIISPLFLLNIMGILFLLLFTACKKEKPPVPAVSTEKNSVKSESPDKKDEKNVIHEENSDLKRFFSQNDISGSITIYDYKNKKWIYSDKEDAEIRTLPASTFKIPNSLIFLEEGLVKDENEAIKWDGTNWKHEEWNKDTSLKEAFKNSTVWFHKEQARKIGKEKYQKYLKEFNYGNQNITVDSSGKPDEFNNFWLNGILKISPIEQIIFLLGLYDEKYPISKKNYTIMKDVMIETKNDSYILRAKTGWGITSTEDIGWYVGYVETKENVYFFATRLVKNENDKKENFASLRKTITFEVLRYLKIIE